MGRKHFIGVREKCVYCTIIEWELKDRKRIIYENDKFFSNFVLSLRRFPLKLEYIRKSISHVSKKMNEQEKEYFSDAMQVALSKIYKGALRILLIIFIFIQLLAMKGITINTIWHLNILPKTNVWAGFELGVGVEISTIEPEKAAEFLREIK